MQNQGFYLKFGEFSGKTTSLDTKLQVKKKKSKLLKMMKEILTMNTLVLRKFSIILGTQMLQLEKKQNNSYMS